MYLFRTSTVELKKVIHRPAHVKKRIGRALERRYVYLSENYAFSSNCCINRSFVERKDHAQTKEVLAKE